MVQDRVVHRVVAVHIQTGTPAAAAAAAAAAAPSSFCWQAARVDGAVRSISDRPIASSYILL